MGKRLVIVELRQDPQARDQGPFRGPVSMEVPGFTQDPTYEPEPGEPTDPQRSTGEESVVFIRGEVDELQLSHLKRHPRVLGVWDDGEIGPVGPLATGADGSRSATAVAGYRWLADCDPQTPKGSLEEVVASLGCRRFWDDNMRGDGVAIAICDAGVDARTVPRVGDGWAPDGTLPFGQAEVSHGSMCATAALAVAPGAEIYDVGVLKSQQAGPLLSNVLKGYDWILKKYGRERKPQVVCNSWALYRKGLAPQYASECQHPVTRRIGQAVDAGICVLFAAGNCGGIGDPLPICGTDTGPGQSIWGANGHPKVMTVGAANLYGHWIGYTSQGPAALCEKKPDFCARATTGTGCSTDPQSALWQRKPDFCAPSHYRGFTLCDSGTSSACALAAGVVALLRQACPSLDPAAIKQLLADTTDDLCEPGWDPFSGHGMINAGRAFESASRIHPTGTATGG